MSPQQTSVQPVESSPGSAYAFAAFLSYSHAADNSFAPALQAALHRFAKPWYRLRAIRVFRDESTLATTPGLWSAIRAALDDSQYFVLLASPDAAASHWVAREVAYWCGARGSSSLLIVLTAGDLVWDDGRGDFDWDRTTALPPVLRGGFGEEPLYLDSRDLAHDAGRLSLRDAEFRALVADLAATLRGRPKDELLGEDVRQHAITRRWVRSAIALLITLLLVAVASAIVAVVQRNEAREQARTATSRLLASQAVTEDRIDRSMFLALASWQLRPGPEARGALAEVLARDSRAVRVLEGRGRIDDVAFSPDGAVLAATGRDGTVTFWRFHDSVPTLLDVIEVSDLPLRSLAFDPDGDRLAVAGNDGHVVVLDVSTLEPIGLPIRNSDSPERVPVLALAFTGEGRHVLVGDEDGVVRLWDPATRTKLAETVDGHGRQITDLAISPDGELAATGGADMTVRVWRTESLEPVGPPLEGHTNWVRSVAFRPGGEQLVSAGQDRSIVFWDVQSGERLGGPVTSGNGPLRGLAFSPDGDVLYAASEDRTVRQWNLADSRQPGVAVGTVGGPALSVAVRRQGDLLASSGDDGTVVLWNLGASSSQLRRPLIGGPTEVTSAAFVAGGRQLATAQPNGSVRLWDVETRRSVEPPLIPSAGDQRRLLAADDRGHLLAVSGRDSVELWDVADRAVSQVVPMTLAPSALASSPDGRRLAIAVTPAEGDSRVHLWDVGTGTMESQRLTTDRGVVNDLAFSPDGTRLAAATHDYSLVVWNLDDGSRRSLRTDQAGQTTAVAFVSASVVASGSDDGSVVLTDIRTGKAAGLRMTGHSGRVRALASAPEEGLVASGGNDGNVVLWDVRTQTRLGRGVVAFDGAVNALEASADGATLVSAGTGGATFTSTDVDTWRAQACRITGRDLSAPEWRSFVGDGFPQEPLCAGTTASDGE